MINSKNTESDSGRIYKYNKLWKSFSEKFFEDISQKLPHHQIFFGIGGIFLFLFTHKILTGYEPVSGEEFEENKLIFSSCYFIISISLFIFSSNYIFRVVNFPFKIIFFIINFLLMNRLNIFLSKYKFINIKNYIYITSATIELQQMRQNYIRII